MIIAMLLGPITGISLALVDSDMKLLLRGLGTLVAGALVVMATGLIIGTIHSDVPVSKEIMARTAPNLADLVVALAGGAAGAYATVSPRLSVALVGVAIATALVPPLTAATILLARGEVDAASGAFLLTFVNIVAIQFASSVVFWSAGFRQVSRTRGISFLVFFKSNAVSILILGVLAVMLTDSLHEVLTRRIYESAVRSTLQREFDNSPGSHLVEVRFDEADRARSIVRAVVRGPNPPSPAQVAAMEATLPAHPGRRPVELRVRFVPTTIINRDGVLLEDAAFHAGE
jgi:uncharacterized hydrophobic protein (TIGR00271 family)